MLNDFGESKVTIKKQSLLEVIRKNRSQHIEDFSSASSGYKDALVERLKKMLASAKAGKMVEQSVGLIPPVSHEKEYDVVIRMLEMSTADEISITQAQFTQYVMDDWNWKQNFTTTNRLYSKMT